MNQGVIYSIAISLARGQLKREVAEANIIADYGIENDGHAGNWHRQVTCLNWASVKRINEKYNIDAGPGDFAENILIDGLDFSTVKIGSKIQIAPDIILVVTQIGKENHQSIVSQTFGISLLPEEGLFCRVIAGGRIQKGATVIVI